MRIFLTASNWLFFNSVVPEQEHSYSLWGMADDLPKLWVVLAAAARRRQEEGRGYHGVERRQPLVFSRLLRDDLDAVIFGVSRRLADLS